MLGNGRTTQTINELIIDSLERTTTARFLEANHFISNTTFAHTTSGRKYSRVSTTSPGHFPRSARRHCRDIFATRAGAARNQPLRENAEFIHKTRNHKSAAVRQRIQRFTHDVLGRLINEAKLSIAVFRFPAVAIGKNPARAERDHTHSARSEFFLKPQGKTC